MQRDDVAQEELLFHLRPELLAVMLITRALNDDEAIVIKGAETFSSHTGGRRNGGGLGASKSSQRLSR